jgi:putative membrane protein
MMWGYGGWNWLWMMPAMLVFWAITVGLIVWAVRATTGPGRDGDSALQTLRQRLASGEITRDEFEQMKHALTR